MLALVLKNLPPGAGDVEMQVWSLGQVGNGNLLQYSCLENSMESGAWRGAVELQRVEYDWSNWAQWHMLQNSLGRSLWWHLLGHKTVLYTLVASIIIIIVFTYYELWEVPSERA